MSPLPANLEKVAAAGGWDERALEVLKEMKSIKKEEWGIIHENLKTLKGFIEMNAEGVLNSFTESLTTTMQLKFEEVLAPLKNEWNALINELLEPLIPMLQGFVTFAVPIVQWIADTVGVIATFINSLNIPALIPPASPGVMMTYAQWEADRVRRNPLETGGPWWAGFYQDYVDEWMAAHAAQYQRTGLYNIE